MIDSNRHHIRALLFAAACIALPTVAAADPVDIGDNKVPTRTIELAEDNDLGGRVARFDGVVSDRGQRLIVKGLDVMSPLVIRVLAKDVGKPVDVSLHRYFWGKPDAEGSTGPRGDWEFRGRAHDEVGIALSVPATTPVYALVWQGPPVPGAAVPMVVVDTNRKAAGSGEAGGGGMNMMTLGIIGLLIVIAILLTLQLLQRRNSSATALLAAAILMMVVAVDPAVAQTSGDTPPNPFVDETVKPPAQEQPPNPFADDQKPQGEDFKPEDAGPKPNPKADKPQTGDSKLKPDPNADKPQSGDSKLKPDPNADKPQSADSKPKPDPDETVTADSDIKPGSIDSDDSTSSVGGDTGEYRSFDERLESVYADIRQLRSEIAANAARIRNLEFLINQDRGAIPAPGDGAPPISISCDNDPACQACLEQANRELSELLVNLDKLRIIYVNYMRYRDYMVGLGDAISGFHQLEQMAWYQTKLQIEEATIGLQGAYDAKFEEFKVTLSDSLATLSACDSVEGDPIFSRESVLFENYVKAKYARDE